MIDFVIINYNTPELTCKCIETIFYTYNQDSNIIVVDNNSSDNSLEYIKEKFPQVNLIANNSNLGYAKAVNIGVNSTNSSYVLVTNSDVEFHKNSIYLIEKMLIENNNIGVAGFLQFYPNKSPQRSYGYYPSFKLAIFELFFLISFIEKFNLWKRKFEYFQSKNFSVDYIDGAALLIRKDLFHKLNGFDEDYFFYSEEADFCYRVSKNGYKNTINPKATITHIRGGSNSENNNFNLKSILMNENANFIFLKKNCNRFIQSFFIFSRKFRFSLLNKIAIFISYFKNNNEKDFWQKKSRNYSEISFFWKNINR